MQHRNTSPVAAAGTFPLEFTLLPQVVAASRRDAVAISPSAVAAKNTSCGDVNGEDEQGNGGSDNKAPRSWADRASNAPRLWADRETERILCVETRSVKREPEDIGEAANCKASTARASEFVVFSGSGASGAKDTLEATRTYMLVSLEGGSGAGTAAREGSGGGLSGVVGKTGGLRYDTLANGHKRGFISRPSLDAATAPTAAARHKFCGGSGDGVSEGRNRGTRGQGGASVLAAAIGNAALELVRLDAPRVRAVVLHLASTASHSAAAKASSSTAKSAASALPLASLEAALSLDDVLVLEGMVQELTGAAASVGGWLAVLENILSRIPAVRECRASHLYSHPIVYQEMRCKVLNGPRARVARGIGGGGGGCTLSELAGAMTAALADTDLPLRKILSDPGHAIHLKKLRQRLAFRWSNASIISAFQQWAHTVSAEKQRIAAMAAGERAAATGSWKSGFLLGPLRAGSYSNKVAAQMVKALTKKTEPSLTALSEVDHGFNLARTLSRAGGGIGRLD
jgi:hypothetical protein